MALGNIFSPFCPSDDRSLENGGIFGGGGVPPEQEDRLRIAECRVPIGVKKECLRPRAGGRNNYSLHPPAVKNVSPAGPESHHGPNLAQEVVAIEISTAVREYAIFGIKLPDRIASPVVVNENSPGIVASPQERDRLLGKLLRLNCVLVAGKGDPFHQCK